MFALPGALLILTAIVGYFVIPDHANPQGGGGVGGGEQRQDESLPVRGSSSVEPHDVETVQTLGTQGAAGAAPMPSQNGKTGNGKGTDEDIIELFSDEDKEEQPAPLESFGDEDHSAEKLPFDWLGSGLLALAALLVLLLLSEAKTMGATWALLAALLLAAVTFALIRVEKHAPNPV
jgi:hypothetical protein